MATAMPFRSQAVELYLQPIDRTLVFTLLLQFYTKKDLLKVMSESSGRSIRFPLNVEFHVSGKGGSTLEVVVGADFEVPNIYYFTELDFSQ